MKSRILLTALTLGGCCGIHASPLASEPFLADEPWFLPGGEQGVLIQPSSEILTSIAVPPLSLNEQRLPEGWRGLISLGLYGTSGEGSNQVTFEAFEPESGKVIASAQSTVTGNAPREQWTIIASSEHSGSPASHAFDGDPSTSWHSRYGKEKAPAPHWIGLTFAKPHTLQGLQYTPRQKGYSNGVAKSYRVEIQREGSSWEPLTEGTTEQADVSKKRKPLLIDFDKPVTLTGVRFVILSDWSGGGFGTCGELTPLGIRLPKKVTTSALPGKRIWLDIPSPLMESLIGQRLGLRAKAGPGQGIIVGEPDFCRINEKPSRKILGKANGALGPDKLGAGLLGFDAVTEHQQTVLTVLAVQKNSPASRAKLRIGDTIVAVAGRPLPSNDLNPGWTWLEQSHEAILGRATEEAIQNGHEELSLTVLREGKTEDLELAFERSKAFTTLDPATDPEAAILLSDMIQWLVDNQKENGSWSNDIKRTTFASLALLATEDPEHKLRVEKAIDWALQKFTSPEKHGNLGFWSAGYMMTLFGEWHLHTNDERVLHPIKEARDWAVAGQHKCKWGMPALGHGPSGLPYGEKSLVAPACHLLVGEALTRQCGIESQVWELLDPYMVHSWSDPKDGGHGAMGYNGSYKDLAQFWSRSGLYLMASHLRNAKPAMRDALAKIMQERHPWLRNSHAYGEPGGAWGLLGLSLAAPERFQKVIKDYAWWFSLAWEPGYGLHYTTPHMGAPYMGEDDLMNCIYPLVLQAPKRNLYLTGRGDRPKRKNKQRGTRGLHRAAFAT